MTTTVTMTEEQVQAALANKEIGMEQAISMIADLRAKAGPKGKGRKTECPISREDFTEHAKDIAIDIGGTALTAEVKEFSTGSFGWNTNGKMNVKVGGKVVTCQVSLNLTVIGSKEV